VAQRGGGVSTLGDTQKLSELGPGQLALGGPAWSGGLDQMTSRIPFQPQTFCDPVNSAEVNTCSIKLAISDHRFLNNFGSQALAIKGVVTCFL